MQSIAMIFLEIGTGFAGAKLGIITQRDSKFLSNLIMSITLPCTLLASANIESGRSTVVLMLLGALLLELLYLVSTALCHFLAKRMKLTSGQTAVFIGVTVLPNSAFIGIPLAVALLGEAMGTVYGASGIIAYNLFFFTYVVGLFEPGKKPELKNFITPTNITTLVMIVMLLLGVHLPGTLQDFCAAMGACTTPLALLIVGIMLAGSDLKELIKKPLLYVVTVLRCLVFPLLFILVLWLLPLDRTMCMGVAILASCPSGNLTAVLARQRDIESELAGQAVTQSTLVILITIPILLSIASFLFGI